MEIIVPTEGDSVRVANILVDAYEYQPVTQLLFKAPASDKVRRWFEGEIHKSWGTLLRRAVRDTTTGEIISQAAFKFVPADSGQGWKKPPQADAPPADVGMNGEVFARFATVEHEKRMKHMGPTAFIYLQGLSTDPKAERRGAGGILLTYLTELADKYNLPLFLTATSQGRGLYKKHGFEEKETFEYDLSSIDQSPSQRWAMIRPAARSGEPYVVPAQPLQPVRIVPMESDMEECRNFERAGDEAMGPDPLVELAFFGAVQDTLDERAANALERVQKPDEFLFEKAIDPDTNEVLGYSKWMLAADPQKKMYPFARDWPRGANVPLCEAVFGKLSRHREDYFKERNEPYAYMSSLMIKPSAQRRGVGSALLRSGLKVLDERGWKAYIDASPSGAPLYRKFGWKDDMSISTNLKDYGGPDLVETVLGLIREPHAKEEPRQAVAT